MILTFNIRPVGAKGRAKKHTQEVASFEEARKVIAKHLKSRKSKITDIEVKSKALA